WSVSAHNWNVKRAARDRDDPPADGRDLVHARLSCDDSATMPDASTLMIARVHGVAVCAAELTDAARELAAAALAQDGCLGFDVLAEPGATAELVLMSAWRSEAAMRAHFASGAYGRYVATVSDLLTRPSDVAIHSVSGSVHPLPDLSTEPQRAS